MPFAISLPDTSIRPSTRERSVRFSPSTKNVACARKWRSTSSTCGVNGDGPSSKLSAIAFVDVETLVTGVADAGAHAALTAADTSCRRS